MSSASGARGRGLFAIERNQIGGNGFYPQLAQHRDHLPTVIGRVVGDCMQALPHGIGKRVPGEAFVVHHAVQVLRRELRYEVDVVMVHFLEFRAHRGEIREHRAGDTRGWRTALDALVPHPFGAVKVREGVANGTKTRSQIACELFAGERGAGVQCPQIGPQIVLVQNTEQFRRHHQFPPGNSLYTSYGPESMWNEAQVAESVQTLSFRSRLAGEESLFLLELNRGGIPLPQGGIGMKSNKSYFASTIRGAPPAHRDVPRSNGTIRRRKESFLVARRGNIPPRRGRSFRPRPQIGRA